MPKRVVHKGTGFMEYTRTPQERKMVQLEQEVSELKELKAILQGINPEDLKKLINKKGGAK